MRRGIRWENQKGKRAGLGAGRAGGWYQCLLLFAGAALAMCSAYMQLMDLYPQFRSLELSQAYVWYVLCAAAAFALIYGSGKLKYCWLRLLPALPLGWCFFRYYKDHQLPLEDGSLYIVRCYADELERFFRKNFFLPGGIREEAPGAFLFWSLLLLCVFFILAAVLRSSLLILLLPGSLLAAHIAVGRSPGWGSVFVLLAAGVLLASQWKAAPDRWYVRTAQLAGLLCICIITSLVCASIPRQVVGMHKGIQAKQLALEDAALALPVWGLFERHGVVDNHRPGTTGREVLRVWLSDQPTENIYLKNYAASRYADGRWSQDAESFAAAAGEQGLTASSAGRQLLSGAYETAADIFGNEEAIDFLSSGGWSMAKPGEYSYRVTCRDFGTGAPLPYVSTLPEQLSMDGDAAAKRPWNVKSYGGSLMMGGRASDPVAEYLRMYYTAKEWMRYADSYFELLSSSQFFDFPGTGEPLEEKEYEWYTDVVHDCYCVKPDKPFIMDFMAEHVYDGNFWDAERLFLDSFRESGQTDSLNNMRLTWALNVQQWMQSFGAYSQSLDPLPEGEDPIGYFLRTSEQGYCVHYASAAALILQTIGVPARYASGYVVFPYDFERAKDGDGYTAHVVDKRAHAWVEIYLEGFGWLPVEVTPGFAGGGEQDAAQEGEHEAADHRQSTDNQPEDQNQKEPQEEDSRPLEENRQENPQKAQTEKPGGLSREMRLALYWLAGAVAAALLAYVSLCIMRKRGKQREQQIRKLLEAGRYNEAANKMNRHIYRRLRRRAAGIGVKDDAGYRDALKKLDAGGDADAYIRLVKQAYFSDAEMCAEDALSLYEMYRVYRGALRRRKTRP